MTEDSGEHVDVPAIAEKAHGERVTEGMGRESNSPDAEFVSKQLEIAQEVALRDRRSIPCAKYEIELETVASLEQHLPAFHAEWNHPYPLALAFHFQKHIIEVYLAFREAQGLLDA